MAVRHRYRLDSSIESKNALISVAAHFEEAAGFLLA
jgi:hypothetical protein